jgi:hypothetical protein
MSYSKLSKYSMIPNGIDKALTGLNRVDTKQLNYIVGSSTNSDWLIFNIGDILERKDDWIDLKFIDIGALYHGMGHFVTLGLIKENGKFFFKIDGGSNGYDRIYNMHKFKNYDPLSEPDKVFNLNKMLQKLTLKLQEENIHNDMYHNGIEEDGKKGLDMEIEKMKQLDEEDNE